MKKNHTIWWYWDQKIKFHQDKRHFNKYIYIIKIVVPNKISFGKKRFKYFIGYKNTKKIKPMCIFLPKMSAYRKEFNETKYMSFLSKKIKNDKSL